MKKRLVALMLMVIIALGIISLSACNVISYEIIFIVDGEEYDKISTTDRKQIKMPENPEKEGYVFKGWFFDEGEYTKPFTLNAIADAPLEENMKVYAKFVSESEDNSDEGETVYEITFMVDGVEYHKLNVAFGEQITLPSDPEKNEHKFDGWFLDDGVFSKPLTLSSLAEEATDGKLTVYAKLVFAPVVEDEPEDDTAYYTVTFDSAGGSEVEPLQVAKGDKVAEPTNPNRAGYSFDGWYIDDEKWSFAGFVVTSDITLTAKWNPHYNVLHLNGNGATDGSMADISINTGATVSIAANRYVMVGYSFAGWSVTPDGEVAYADGAEYTMGVEAEYTLYAKWTANINTLRFDANGGSGSMSSMNIYTGATVALKQNSFTREYCEFVGWATTPGGEVVYTNGADYTMGTNTEYVLYAVWDVDNNITEISYSAFGAVGDGVADDFNALLQTHEFANLYGVKVTADTGKTYYIGTSSLGKTIPIMTDVDWKDATFIIDDTVDGIHENGREYHIFRVVGNNYTEYGDTYTYPIENDISIIAMLNNGGSALSLKAGATSIDWLAPLLDSEYQYMVELRNDNHKDYVRVGLREDGGYSRREFIIVDGYGNIDVATPLTADFDAVTFVGFKRTDDAALTISGGKFLTIANVSTEVAISYYGYARGILVSRSNTTITGLDHQVTGEGTYGYPYTGFIKFYRAYNCTLESSCLAAHKEYRDSNGLVLANMDLLVENSVDISLIDVSQYGDIKNQWYWSIMGGRNCRNLTIDSCIINGMNIYFGLWNIDVKDTTIGSSITFVGGGTANFTSVTKRCGASFIQFREDYGSSFNGDVNIKDCTLDGYQYWIAKPGEQFQKRYYTTINVIDTGIRTTSDYLNHDFGYQRYLPKYVTIDNFKFSSQISNIYVFEDIADSAFSSAYVITKQITIKNMTRFPTCSSASGQRLRSISVRTA